MLKEIKVTQISLSFAYQGWRLVGVINLVIKQGEMVEGVNVHAHLIVSLQQ